MLAARAGIEPTTFWLRDDCTPSQPQSPKKWMDDLLRVFDNAVQAVPASYYEAVKPPGRRKENVSEKWIKNTGLTDCSH